MLNKPITKVVYNEQGEACGVTSEGETAKCKFVVGDPSYFPDKVILFRDKLTSHSTPCMKLSISEVKSLDTQLSKCT